MRSKLKSEKSKKNKHINNVVFKKKRDKKDIKKDMICVMRPLNICLLISRIHTSKHYTIALKQTHLNKVLILILFLK